MTQHITGGELLVQSLIAHDVDTIFGIPGIQLYELVNALYDVQDRIELIAPRHEQSTTYMADGYARVTHKPGVAMVVPGPGVLNATAGLATAFACSSPVLLLCGQIDSELMTAQKFGALHEIQDQTDTLRGLTKWVGTAHDPREIPDLVAQAFVHMTSGVPGPVALEIPPNILAAEVVDAPLRQLMVPETQLTPAQVSELVATVTKSVNPYILVGGGAINAQAGEVLGELATLLNCPIVQTRNGRGAIDTSHPNAFDPYMRDLVLDDADLAIVVGSRMGSGAGSHIALGTENIININADVHALGYPRPFTTHAVLGDARSVVHDLLEAVREQSPEYRSGWDMAMLGAAREKARERLEVVAPQRDYLASIRESFDRDTVLVSEYTQVGYLSTISYPVTTPGAFISPGYQGTLGYGFATAIGAQIGAKGRRVVSINGDGGFSWTLPELATLKRYGVPLVAIVFNDGRYGNVYRSQKYVYQDRIIGSELTNPDFATLAQAYGIRSYTVHSPSDLAEVCARVRNDELEPVLIEVVVDELPSAWHLFDEPGQ